MSIDFTSIRNHHEHLVFDAVLLEHANHPELDEDTLPDVACVALNRLPARYIRHAVDMAFYLTERERNGNDAAIAEAVRYAFDFVIARQSQR
jgi:hypothetical protein